jgi:DNA repair ATPase RecN
MAELHYEDVKRATQEAVRNLQGMVGEMRSSHDDIRRNIQQLDVVNNRLGTMQAQMNAVQQQFDTQINVVRTLQATLQSMQQWQAIISDMARRIASMEQVLSVSYQGISMVTQHMQTQQSNPQRR